MQIYRKTQPQITCFSQVFKSVTKLELQLQLAGTSQKSPLNYLCSHPHLFCDICLAGQHILDLVVSSLLVVATDPHPLCSLGIHSWT